ncbi:MAG: hypothetical protein CMF39_04270 [Legionellaceae bacterium]|nr:hypothetical protein [Legionellaceae bacterium]
MFFLAGPRQVGKTTIAKTIRINDLPAHYLSWDDLDTRQLILSNQVAAKLGIDQVIAGQKKPTVIFDELHKNPQWKTFLKGFFDIYKEKINIIVTGSAKLDVYRKGGDSMMGRYFLTRVHPLSVRELLSITPPKNEVSLPKKIEDKTFDVLLEFGGFPEPFLKRDQRFSNNWKRMRQEQLFREDIRDLTNVRELTQLETLAEIIKLNATKQVNLTKLGSRLQIASTTVKRWISTLSSFYFSFTIQPWHKNITRSLSKEPKIYLWDWAEVSDKGAKNENFIAAHLLKAVHFWTDYGLGTYELYYLRDLEKREVDFVVVKNGKPWMLVETKSSHKESINPALKYFQQQTKAPYAFQVALDLDYQDINCFDYHEPVIVSAKTLLSQLI